MLHGRHDSDAQKLGAGVTDDLGDDGYDLIVQAPIVQSFEGGSRQRLAEGIHAHVSD